MEQLHGQNSIAQKEKLNPTLKKGKKHLQSCLIPLCLSKTGAFLQLTRLLRGHLGGCGEHKALGLCKRSEYREQLIVAGELSFPLNLAVTSH